MSGLCAWPVRVQDKHGVTKLRETICNFTGFYVMTCKRGLMMKRKWNWTESDVKIFFFAFNKGIGHEYVVLYFCSASDCPTSLALKKKDCPTNLP